VEPRSSGLLGDSVRMLGTLHARSATEALRVMCYEAGLRRTAISTPFVFAVIVASWSGQGLTRRVVELGFLPPGGDVVLLTSATDPTALDPTGLAALAAWQAIPPADVADQIAAHAAQLAI